MSEDEIIDRAEALPDRSADRVTESTLRSIKRMRGRAEYGELTIEIPHRWPRATGRPRRGRQTAALPEAMGLPIPLRS